MSSAARSDAELFEPAALFAVTGRLQGDDLLHVLRAVEPGWSDSTYRRRFNDAVLSLEKKGALSRMTSGYRVDWTPTLLGIKLCGFDQLFGAVSHLHRLLEETRAEADHSSARSRDLQRDSDSLAAQLSESSAQLEELKASSSASLERRLNGLLPKLRLTGTTMESVILLALMEMMIRIKLTALAQTDSQEKDADHGPINGLLPVLRRRIGEVEGREFKFHQELTKGLYDLRSRMIHNGLAQEVRPNELDAIRSLILDLYEQLFDED